MRVQPFNYYICTRCQVQGVLMYTKTCWSCGEIDMLKPSNPFQAHNFTGMTMGPAPSRLELRCDSQQSESYAATFAARFGGAWRGRYAPSPSAAPDA